MARIGKMRRQFVKSQFQKMMEGDLVSDQEKNAFQQQAQQSAEQGLGAQQAGLAQVSQSLSQGSPLAAGAMQGSAQKIGGLSADAAVKASGQANQLAAAVREKRAAQALGAGERLNQANKEDVAFGLETGFRVAEIAAEIAPLIAGAA